MGWSQPGLIFMADARLHIVNAKLGIAARFYARSGIHYSLAPDSLNALLSLVSDKLATDDGFFISENESEFERIDGNLFKYLPGPKEEPRDPFAEDNARLRKDNEALKNRLAVLEYRISCEREWLTIIVDREDQKDVGVSNVTNAIREYLKSK